jgi:hypothetical protein
MEKKKNKLQDIITDFTRGVLGQKHPYGMCLVVCWPLQGFLMFMGIDCELVEGTITQDDKPWQHFWLQRADGTIIDPTASQFYDPEGNPMPEIYIGPLPDWYKLKNTE